MKSATKRPTFVVITAVEGIPFIETCTMAFCTAIPDTASAEVTAAWRTHRPLPRNRALASRSRKPAWDCENQEHPMPANQAIECTRFFQFLLSAHPPSLWRDGHAQPFHFIEHPIEGICSVGPWPVSATCFIASKRSRLASATGVIREASSLPRYCSSS
jgi:hypothetical protein